MRGSPRPRAGYVALAASVAVLAACGSNVSSSPQHCATSAECPAGSRCISSACVANAPPVADVVVPAGPIEANVLVSVDAAASHDPDADDAISSYAWIFRASAESPCAPPVVAGTLPVATVRFACAGHYEGELTVTDRLGATGGKTFAIDVAPYSGPAMVTAGPDVPVEHACTSLPTRCQLASGDVALSAATPDLAPDGLTFHWTVEPPANRALDANRRVVFSPSDAVAAPSVAIETDGQAISGDWVFRVEARDAAGVVGTAATRVSVGNRPPIVTKTIPVAPHAFTGSAFTASGAVPFTVSDPDGDGLVGPIVEWRHAGDGAGTFAGALLADPARVTFDVSVPYATPADGQLLIGGAGLERTIAFGVADVNGATVSESWPIAVENRPPVLASAPGPSTVEHFYDGAAQAYRATPVLSRWLDPDGDPLFQVPSSDTGDPLCGSFTVSNGSGERVATAACELAFGGSPAALANLVGAHVVAQAIQDPWVAAAGRSTVTFTIGNRPPSITSLDSEVIGEGCRRSGMCGFEGTEIRYAASAVTVSLPRWTDPDGDPVSVVAGGSAPDVVPVQPWMCAGPCALPVDIAAMTMCGGSAFRTLSLTVSDGLASASGAFTIERSCATF